MIAAALAGGADVARGAAWTPSATFEGEVGLATMNARGDVAALGSAIWPDMSSRVYVRPAGGSFSTILLPERFGGGPLALSDTGELMFPMTRGRGDAPTSLFHRAASGEQTVTPLPGLREVRIALREDGLGVMFARQGDQGAPVMAWKQPGQATFGEPTRLDDVEPVRPSSFPDQTGPFQAGPTPDLAFTEGLAVMLMRRGEAMEVRAAPPNGPFGAPHRLGPANGHTRQTQLQGSDGHMVATWDDGGVGFRPRTILAATKRPGQGFGAMASVATALDARSPPISVGRNGHVIAVWQGIDFQRAGTLYSSQALEQRPGTSGFQPMLAPAELASGSAQAQFDSQGAAVLTAWGSSGSWTWSRAADGTLAGPDLVARDTPVRLLALNGRGRGVALGTAPDLKRTVVYDYDESASRGRTAPVLSDLAVPRIARTAAAGRRRTTPGRVALRLTKTARVRLRAEQLGRAGIVRARCKGQARRKRRTCYRRRAISGWRHAQVGANELTHSRALRRFLARPGLYRLSARPRDKRGRYGKARSVRVRVKR